MKYGSKERRTKNTVVCRERIKGLPLDYAIAQAVGRKIVKRTIDKI